jgi:hypothetical protein
MADFVLSAEVIVEGKNALEETSAVNESFAEMGMNILQTSKTGKALFSKLGAGAVAAGLAIAGLAMLAGGAFGYITSWSPSLQAAFSIVSVNAGLAAMEIGEALAPMIEDILIPASEKLLEVVTNMDPNFKKFIGVVLALAVGLGVLVATLAVGAAAILLFTSPIGIAILVIAALIVWGGQLAELMGNLRNKALEFFDGLRDKLTLAKKDAGPFKTFFINAVEKVIDVFEGLVVIILEVVSAIGALFSGDFEGFKNSIMNIGRAIINMFLDSLNFLIFLINDTILGINKVFGTSIGYLSYLEKQEYDTGPVTGTGSGQGGSAKTIDQILAEQEVATNSANAAGVFHSGGIFMGNRPGLALLKPGERVLTETEQRSLGIKGGSVGGEGMQTITHNYNITINGGTYTSPAQRRMEAERFAKQLETQSNSRGFI